MHTQRKFWASRLLLAVAIVSLVSMMGGRATGAARDIYVAPNGLSTNDGSLAHPLDLATALSGSVAHPGDTIWLRGGTYVGTFTSNLTGTSAAPITVRQFPGERATLDAQSPTNDTFDVNGSNAIYWGFEVTNSNPDRTIGATLTIYGSATKFINMVVHEGGAEGIGFWTPAVNAELYGTIIYNNGFDRAGDRGYGHSVYTQNQSGVKLITDNIMLNSFSFGIHAYTQGGNVDNFDIEGNILFNNGMASSVSGAKSNLLLGGSQVAHNAIIRNNYSYYPRGVDGRGADIGYGTACDTVTIQNNYFAADTAINLNCSNATVTGNQFYGAVNSNVSLGAANTIYAARPTGVQAYVRPNKYEPGRANIVIYNWSLLPQVGIDLSHVTQSNGQPLLAGGQGYKVRDSENFFGPAVATGTYTGSPIVIPMTGLTAVAPIDGHATVHTAPEFGAFVLLPIGGVTTGPAASFSASPTAIAPGQTATLSWTTANASHVAIDQGIGSVAASGTTTVSPVTTTTYTLTAQDTSSHSVTNTATVAVATSQASFVKVDTATHGTWRGAYGHDGYSLANDKTSLPSYVQLKVQGANTYTWASSTTDSRALQKALPATDRIAATWYSSSSFTMDVNLTDGQPHNVALYNLDWDNANHPETITVLDVPTGAVLDTRTLATFQGGQYTVWQVTGHVVIQITWGGGNNAVASGVFFDPIAGVVTPPPPPSSTAAFVKTDTTTTGSWKGAYGTDGYSLANDATSLPTYAQLAVTGASTWTWTSSTTDPRALQKGGAATGRIAATWYSPSVFTMDVNLTDSQPHNVAVYNLDWDNSNHPETITVLDQATGVVLDTRTLATFQSGQYTVWRVSGHVLIEMIWGGGNNAVASGLFFDPIGGTVTPPPPPASAATFVKADMTTEGSWKGVYGTDGYSLVNDATSLPTYARLTVAGASTYTWASSTTDPRALLKSSVASGRIAATWYSSSVFTLDMNLTDGQPHNIALYNLDWDNANHPESIAILDAATGTVLDTRTLTTFQSGQYTVWKVTGHVTIKVTWGGGNNAVLSGVFFDPSGGTVAPPPPPTSTALFVKADTTTEGSWKGVYGADGYSLVNDATSLPSYAQLTVAGASMYTWSSSTTDPRALLKGSAASGRIAATWYSSSMFTMDVNLTDGQPHNIAVYTLDWDNANHPETIAVLDAATGAVLDTRSLTTFQNGQYTVWTVTGHVTLKFTWGGGNNALASAVFFN